MALYRGPIIDPHHHLWDRSLRRHDWLKDATDGPLGRDQLPADYLEAAKGHEVVATVHVEAAWDPSDPIGEIRWLDTLDKPGGVAERYVAHASLASPDIEAVLEHHGAHPRIVGIREILSWHPDPAHSFARRPDIMNDAAWRRGLSLLPRHGLSFDLMITPWQAQDAARLAADFPDVSFILNHCGSPIDRDTEGMARWRAGLKRLAATPNVAIKISDLVAYDPNWTLESLREVVLACIDAFGADRAMFASDYPVVALHASFDETYSAFKMIASEFSDAECSALFMENAQRAYFD